MDMQAITKRMHELFMARTKQQVTDQVQVVSDIVENAVSEISETIDDTETVVFDQCVSDSTETTMAMLEDFQDDCPEFRASLRDLAKKLTEKLPRCPHGVKSSYTWIYQELDNRIQELTAKNKNLEYILEQEFEPKAPTMFEKSFGEYRKIQLCSCSPYWRQITLEAINKLPEAVLKYHCKKLKLSGKIDQNTGDVKFLD